MKNDGVPYEERMEALEEIHWAMPPCEAQIRAMFAIHHERKPYLSEDLLQPKHITRLLLETGSSINEFVRDYGLKRSEGLVVRYVSQTLKYLKQTIPQDLLTQSLSVHLGTLESLVRQVDASLIEDDEAEQSPQDIKRVPRLSNEAARKQLRNILLQSLRAWQARRFEGFADRFVDAQGEALTGSVIEKLTQGYETTFGMFRMDPNMTDNNALNVDETGPQMWRFAQHLNIDAEDQDWYISGEAQFVTDDDIGTLAIRVNQIDTVN
jgi:hypothetical protein